MFIALDRSFATYLPITFFKYRKFIPTYFIITFVLSYLLVDFSVLFLMCGIDLLTPTTCVNIQCVLGTCYQTYWLNFERVVYILIVILTFVLTFKLLIWNIYKKQNISKDLKKANHLTLIECCILIISELIPPTTQSLVPDAFTYLGAIISACQTLGFVVGVY
ncbi:Protein CBG01289 [Caenorhabditis briggsae]|uniref:Protein CBG01289 n=1 Tax=Caenorhabditis briggsae TaxID=6238 RepID=A8WQ20_CAEBR|nr:Protein CBG01289 [Caenorhabditis briggsae]CAP22578.2 Protein CBG01289 [Caenorhabditis briggsae]